MRFFIVLGVLAVAACGPSDTPAPEVAPAQITAAEPAAKTVPPPRDEQFAAAWAEACPGAEPANKGLCKSKGLGTSGFTCDFALGDGEYRRHTADLTLEDGQWVLADPENACMIE